MAEWEQLTLFGLGLQTEELTAALRGVGADTNPELVAAAQRVPELTDPRPGDPGTSTPRARSTHPEIGLPAVPDGAPRRHHSLVRDHFRPGRLPRTTADVIRLDQHRTAEVGSRVTLRTNAPSANLSAVPLHSRLVRPHRNREVERFTPNSSGQRATRPPHLYRYPAASACPEQLITASRDRGSHHSHYRGDRAFRSTRRGIRGGRRMGTPRQEWSFRQARPVARPPRRARSRSPLFTSTSVGPSSAKIASREEVERNFTRSWWWPGHTPDR